MNPNNKINISLKAWMLKWIIGSNALILMATFSVFTFSILTDFKRKRSSIQENLDIATKTFYVSIMKNDRLTLEILFNSIAVNYKSDSFALCEQEKVILSNGSNLFEICNNEVISFNKFQSIFTQDRDYKLVLKINKFEFYKPVIELLTVLLLAFLFIFLIIKIAIAKINNDIISPLINGNSEKVEIEEISKIISQVKQSYENLIENVRTEFKFELSKKIAHDIRSPISTLNLISSKIQDPELSQLQKMVVNQINNIANELLDKSKKINEITPNILEVSRSNFDVIDFIKTMEAEYRIKKRSLIQKIEFKYDLIESKKYKLSKDEQGILYSCINNFIQNSIEATADDGVIEVIVKKSDVNGKSYEIIVKDNGKGIPDHILAKLGTEAISYGKEANNSFNSGNGIALFNAKKDLNQIGAELKIQSQINIGTEITICI